MQEDCVIILAHLSLRQTEWLEPTVVMGLCFCEGALAREVGSGTEREREVCLLFFWPSHCSIVSLDGGEKKQLLKFLAVSLPLFYFLNVRLLW